MAIPEDVERWRRLLEELLEGPAPRGETFELCRSVVKGAPASEESVQAARMLLEGAMADATTDIGHAQQIMRALKAIDRHELSLRQLLPRS